MSSQMTFLSRWTTTADDVPSLLDGAGTSLAGNASSQTLVKQGTSRHAGAEAAAGTDILNLLRDAYLLVDAAVPAGDDGRSSNKARGNKAPWCQFGGLRVRMGMASGERPACMAGTPQQQVGLMVE
jgi:hypothetical protein